MTTSTTRRRRPTVKPLVWTGIPKVRGAYFDREAVDRVVRFLRQCRHVEGRWAGRPLELEPWQLKYLIEPVYGWKNPDGTRIVRTAWWEFPRKQGKSTLAAGLALYHLMADREPGGQVFAAAGDKDQAREVFDKSRHFVASASPSLRRRLLPLRDSITFPATRSKFRVLSSIARLKFGFNVSAAIIDEVHVHKTRDLIEALESGTGSRDQPLVIFITTADEGTEGSIYDEKRRYAERLAHGLIEDETFYGVVFAVPDAADPFKERTWERANPGIDVTVTRAYLRKEAKAAENESGRLPGFKRLHLGIRAKDDRRSYIPLADWDASPNNDIVDERKLQGHRCYGGLVMTSTLDIAALLLVFPDDEVGCRVLPRFWIPKAGLAGKAKRDQAPYVKWLRHHSVHGTEGDVHDYPAMREDIERWAEAFDIGAIQYNPSNAQQFAQELQDEVGLTMVPRRPTIGTMSSATKETLRLVKLGRLRHGGDQVLRFMVDAANVRGNRYGDQLLDRQASTGWIDGVEALVAAVDCWTTYEDEEDVGAIVVSRPR